MTLSQNNYTQAKYVLQLIPDLC